MLASCGCTKVYSCPNKSIHTYCVARPFSLQPKYKKKTTHTSFPFATLFLSGTYYMGVSKNRGTPKWMVYNGKPYKNEWFGGTTISGNTHMVLLSFQPEAFQPTLHTVIHVKLSLNRLPFLGVSVATCQATFNAVSTCDSWDWNQPSTAFTNSSPFFLRSNLELPSSRNRFQTSR